MLGFDGEKVNDMAISVAPVAGALGAVVEGIDLAKADAGALDELKFVLDRHLVLYVPGQDLDRHRLSALGRHFGPPFFHPIVDNGFDDCPEVLELLREEAETPLFGGACWHADVTWVRPAGYVSILHGIEIPPVGGDTAFISTQAAFDALSDGLKDLLRGLEAVHCYHWYERREDPAYAIEHPVVRRHPVTGREGLYVNRMFTNRLKDMTSAESRPLLDYLFDHLERPEFGCRFRWQPGAVLLWDNRFTLHYPIDDFGGQRRRMIRTTSLEAA